MHALALLSPRIPSPEVATTYIHAGRSPGLPASCQACKLSICCNKSYISMPLTITALPSAALICSAVRLS